MAKILAYGGVVVLVDADRFEELDAHHWRLVASRWVTGGETRRRYYAAARIGGKDTVLMHRLILGAQPGEQVDHINGNPLDNRRANLRICTPSRNIQNRPGTGKNTVYRGVTAHRGKWHARIGSGGARRFLGYFESARMAAKAYDRAALEMYGPDAHLNFPSLRRASGKPSRRGPREDG